MNTSKTGPTGPITEAGKAASRENAHKHGLSGAGTVLAPDVAAEVARRTVECREVFRPVNEVERFHVGQYALESVRVEKCQEQEQAILREAARRARSKQEWHEDRCLDTEEIADRLKKQPSKTLARLRQSMHGCDWMIRRWNVLEQIATSGRVWSETERSVALNLLGFDHELRDASTPIDFEGVDIAGQQAALAADRIAELNKIRDEVSFRDVLQQCDVSQGMDPQSGELAHRLRLTRRYEAACHRRMRNSLKMLMEGRLVEGRKLPADFTLEALEAEFHAAMERVAEQPRQPDVPKPTPKVPLPEHAVQVNTPTTPAPKATLKPAPKKGNRKWRREQERRARQKVA